MRDINTELESAIVDALYSVERKGEIVITGSSPAVAANEIAAKVTEVYAGGIFTPEEVFALSALIMYAVKDKRFYDWEMPTLVGLTAEEMEALGRKIRDSVNL